MELMMGETVAMPKVVTTAGRKVVT